MGKRKHTQDRIKNVRPTCFLSNIHTDSQQDMDSRQTCTVCGIDVNVGTGGPKNFEIHLTSKKHLRNVKAAEAASKASKPNRISNFFVKQHNPPPLCQVPPAPQLLAPKTPTSTPASSRAVCEELTTSEEFLRRGRYNLGAEGGSRRRIRREQRGGR